MSRNPWFRAAAFCLAAALTVVVSGAGTEARGQHARRTPIVEAVQKTKPAVVSLKVRKASGWNAKENVGTGVIVDERGYVVTNHHVVAGGDKILIRLHDGTELNGTLAAEDRATDLAIVRIEAKKKLTALPLGPGGDLMVGETVIAVGHPFGYTNTVSTGIVSALGRNVTMPGGEQLSNLIQTDASINPGNSGGPLLNINGELIGINVALRDKAQGIAFAINADTVREVLSRHLSALKISGVKHGLYCKERVVSETGEDRLKVVVNDVETKTPAAKAGLRTGDLLVCVGERAVANRFDVERALWDRRPGEKVGLKVLRQGKEIDLTLTLAQGARPEVATARPSDSAKNRPTAGAVRSTQAAQSANRQQAAAQNVKLYPISKVKR